MAISLSAILRQNKKAWVARKTLDHFELDTWWAAKDRIETRLRSRLWQYVVRIYSGVRKNQR